MMKSNSTARLGWLPSGQSWANDLDRSLVSEVHESALALRGGNLERARQGLLQTSGRLFRDARRMEGELRIRHTELAERFYQQAKRLEQAMAGTTSELGEASDDHLAKTVCSPKCSAVTAATGVSGEAAGPTPLPGLHSLDDLAGVETIRQLLRARFVYPLRHPERARRYRQNATGGVLLFGPPGTGKTLLTRALAAELAIPVFSISPSSVLSKWLGDSEKQLAELFRVARQHPASLIFVDEIDALAPTRDTAGEGSSALQRLLAQLLTELDGFEHQPGQLLFIGASNRPWAVDPALLRPGRFDALVYVGMPEESMRVELLRQRLTGVPMAPKLDLDAVASRLAGYSAAELVAVAAQAARLAFLDAVETDRDRPVEADDLEAAAMMVHRAATPVMLERFSRFAADHGLPALSLPASMSKVADSVEQSFAANSVGRFCPVGTHEINADVELLPFVSSALQHAGMFPLRRLMVENTGIRESRNLVVEVSLGSEDFGTAWVENIAELRPGERWESCNISLPLRLDRLRAVQQREVSRLRVTIRDQDEVLFTTAHELTVLAYNEWLFLPEFPALAAAFVQSNSPALHPIINDAAEWLFKIAGSRAFSAYQSGDPAFVAQMLQAVHASLSTDHRLAYINSPPDFELTRQKIRLVAETIDQGQGTCLDLTILQAALWEHIGLHPCLVLMSGHALLACWTKPQRGNQAAVVNLSHDDKAARALRAALADGSLQLFNSVEVALGQSMVAAQRYGQVIVKQALESGGPVHVIDVANSRARVTPLP
jgi:AAA+ superfamily predicted ATPase